MHFSIKNIVLGFAIFILTLFVGIYGISTFYKEAPKYETYCPMNLNTYNNCMSEGGKWINNTQQVVDVRGGTTKPVPVEGGYCEYDYTKCQKSFDDANKEHYKKVFLIALPLGIVIIAIGALVFGLESVGAGLMIGGVGIIIYGVGGYWQYTDDVMKFALSLAGLIILIALAYYWNKRIHDSMMKSSEKSEDNKDKGKKK